MRKKSLVKVVATSITKTDGSFTTTLARGVSTLKRGQTLFSFMSSFLTERGLTSYSLHSRSDSANQWATSLIPLDLEPKTLITYHFVQFNQDDIGFYIKDLSQDERERDLKRIRKILTETNHETH